MRVLQHFRCPGRRRGGTFDPCPPVLLPLPSLLLQEAEPDRPAGSQEGCALGSCSVTWRAMVRASCVCWEMPLVLVEAPGTVSSGSVGRRRKGKKGRRDKAGSQIGTASATLGLPSSSRSWGSAVPASTPPNIPHPRSHATEAPSSCAPE